MKTHEVHIISESVGFTSMKEKLTEKVRIFLDKKSSQGYEIISVSFTYFEARELIAFITICK